MPPGGSRPDSVLMNDRNRRVAAGVGQTGVRRKLPLSGPGEVGWKGGKAAFPVARPVIPML